MDVKNLKIKAENIKKKSDRMVNYATMSYLLAGGGAVGTGVCALVSPQNIENAIVFTGGFALAGTILFLDSIRLGIKGDRVEEKAKQLSKGK